MRRYLPRVAWCIPVLAAAAVLNPGCQKQPRMELDGQQAELIELMLPQRIELQHDWTRPCSFSGDGQADGVQVILGAFDVFDDRVKVVGTFHFELYTRRMASADKLGERIAFWPVTIDSREALETYWDDLTDFFEFDLRLVDEPLPPGEYILTARLVTPAGRKLYDEYPFTRDAGPAPLIAPGL